MEKEIKAKNERLAELYARDIVKKNIDLEKSCLGTTYEVAENNPLKNCT